ncbi:MAG: bifunctional methylenetetrahydrofolate dehydrogenase/methenyltetrahydrofolate cyclohydrolase [Rickettsiaceae bacterium]|jgi:methylenetetrahydrofolate dehydrogenase (NADP+)/methenyltetrahydrofolate cyclohydrolase|nr:bifunctional methylenetetrahydrofolate dehydrogenase/methenyltetrahydrofolate cyclohydrolase [Rickettsiaceae bacterium]
MTSNKIMSGRELALEKLEEIKLRVQRFKNKNSFAPGIAVILVGNEPASEVYVRNKVKRAEEVGIQVFAHFLPESTSEESLLSLIDKLNKDAMVHGILVQLPLPLHMSSINVLNKILPAKDVDGFSAISVGYLNIGHRELGLTSCTPLGSLSLLKKYEPNLTGKHVVIVGRSNIVGKPMAALLLSENCTVTICHSKTKNLKDITSQADIVVTAIGKPNFFTPEYFKEGVIILDVGINRIEEKGNVKLVGDVAFDEVLPKAKFITPVPGGVGPMTIVSILENTCLAAERVVK